MNITQIEKNLKKLVKGFSQENFIYDLLLAYGQPKNTITLLKKGSRNLSKRDDQIILKKKMFFQKVNDNELHKTIDELRHNKTTMRHDPRFIIVTNYKTLLAVDTKTQDTLDIEIEKLPLHPDFFGPWAGREKYQNKDENIADVKAAERMAKLYDEILKDNPVHNKEELHPLNVFLSRLLFCFFAEDTHIFDENVFTNSINSNTQKDGSDLNVHLNKVFNILNTPEKQWHKYPQYLRVFKYVNGGLFGDTYPSPKFSTRSRKMIIDCGELDWSAINPDIFGSMIQAVVHPDQRGGMGMHYTSVPNIMKVVEPLFLDELKAEFKKYFDNKNKLGQMLMRLEHLRIFDPACGSGNFLIIAYKEIRELEMEIFQRIQEITDNRSFPFSQISLSQFYGIELDDFAHEVAILSLWLAEHQMNMCFKKIFGKTKPSLPLKEGGNIIQGNATRILWEDVCPKDKGHEIYILGNPPYLGSSLQDKEQKADMAHVFHGIKGYKNLDYIACWFFVASQYIQNQKVSFAFVSTNSICQGEQVALLWPHMFNRNLEISFAHTSFKWTNNAKGNAGVTCSIVGVRNQSKADKKIYHSQRIQLASNIGPYLTSSKNLIVTKRSKPLSKLPPMSYGNKAVDGGNLILEKSEYEKLIAEFPNADRFIKKLIGSVEFIRGHNRWCLWIEDKDLETALSISPIKKRINATKEMRLSSSDVAANRLAERPHQFREFNKARTSSIIVPRVSSDRRNYLPLGFLEADTIILDSAQAIYDAESFLLGILSSKIHLCWVRATAGRLKTDYRYSSVLCYNTFPIPDLTEKQKEAITSHVYAVIAARENHSEKTMAELYDPDKMPDELRAAHHTLDLAIEQCYRSKPFTSDEERLEHLFKLYEEMVAKEKTGELL